MDAVYMEVCTALNGSGGWPLTILMTPEQKPFFAGTYLPRENRGQYMGLLPLLRAVAAKWKRNRAELLAAGEQVTAMLRQESAAPAAEADAAVFAKGWEEARGCRIEHEICLAYGIDIVEVYSD